MIPEQSTQKSQAAVADDIARANAPIEKVRSFLFGHDIFISYARADALDYAPRLANQLTKLGFRCYLDQLDAPVGVKTPGAVMRALRRSTSLVIVGTNRAAASAAVGDEVAFFSKLSRTILPIDVDGALEGAKWSQAIAGIAKTKEIAKATENGRPSRQVISRIYDSAQFRRRNQQLKRAAFGVLAIITLLIVAGGGASVFFSAQAKSARTEAGEAEMKRQEAISAAEGAKTLKAQAEKELAEAQKNLETAKTELASAQEKTGAAEAATKTAEASARAAQIEAQNAEQKRAKSEQMVRKQQAIAESLDLANSSTRKLSQGLLEQSTQDAIASGQRLLTVNEKAAEADRALRGSLAVFPKQLEPPRMIEQDGGFSDVSFSPDAEQFIVLNNDQSVQIYDRKSDKAPLQVAPPVAPDAESSNHFNVALSNNLKRWAILKGPGGGQVEVKSIQGNQKWKFDVGQHIFEDLALSADGRYLVAASDQDAQLWDVDEKKQLASLHGSGGDHLRIETVAFSPDGKTLALGGTEEFGKVEQGRIVIWSGFLEGHEIQWKQQEFDIHRQELTLSDERLNCLALTNDAKSYATCSGKTWGQASNGRLEPVVYLPGQGLIRAVAFDSTGQSVSAIRFHLKKQNLASILISGWDEKDVSGWSYDIWDSSGYSVVASIPYSGDIDDIKFDREDRTISAIGKPGYPKASLVRYWNTTDWKELKGEQFGFVGDSSIHRTSGGRFLASARNVDKRITVDVLDLVNRRKKTVSPEETCLAKENVLLSSDGNTLALLCRGALPKPDSVVVYHRETNKFVKARPIELKSGEKLDSLSPDGNFLVVTYYDEDEHYARIIAVVSGKEIDSSFLSGDIVTKPIFSPDSKLLAVGYLKDDPKTGPTAYLEVFRLSDRKKLAVVKGGGVILNYNFSPDSNYIVNAASGVNAAAGLDGKLTIIDLRGNNSVTTEFNFAGGVGGIFFDGRSRLLAALTEDTIRVIDLRTAREIAEIPGSENVAAVAFSHDGKYLATAMDLKSGSPHSYALRVWLLSPEELLNEASTRLNQVVQ
jgi:WD40 repeat protein